MHRRGLTFRQNGGTGHGQRLWPVLLLLVLAAVVPTACVLWFMSEAMANERFAVRQRLADVYRAQLEPVSAAMDFYWRTRLSQVADAARAQEPRVLFEQAVRAGGFDGIIVVDAEDRAAYPPRWEPLPPEEPWGDAWEAARRLEFEENQPQWAAVLFLNLAEESQDDAIVARALLAAARCMLKADQPDRARKILLEQLREPRFANVRDASGRLIVPDALLLSLRAGGQADDFVAMLRDYQLEIPPTQRVFLMEQVLQAMPEGVSFPTLDAERLARRYLESGSRPPSHGHLAGTTLPDVWQIRVADRPLIALVSEANLRAAMHAMLSERLVLTDAQVDLLAPGEQNDGPEPLVAIPVSPQLPDWSLAVTLTGSDPFATASQRRLARYLWVGILVALLTLLLGGVLAGYVGRQVKLTRLKNDLIATVSHELKTPLASIRALVDTLLSNGTNPKQSREYLELIARENLRLSRLIDNFLTFSRMERRKHAFDFAPVQPGTIVHEAVDAVRERFEAGACRLDVHVAPGLGEIVVDRDAMVIVLLNLLDNAYKYSGQQKEIHLAVEEREGHTWFTVRDNGIGMSRRATRKIFRQFYQVDQTLSRRTGGCGLGLSIVKFIVDAHGGAIDVESQPGRGSTFTVRIPSECTGAELTGAGAQRPA